MLNVLSHVSSEDGNEGSERLSFRGYEVAWIELSEIADSSVFVLADDPFTLISGVKVLVVEFGSST